MDEHDQAAAWAQANSQDPRAQDIMAKAWAAKNPDDPRAGEILKRFGAPEETKYRSPGETDEGNTFSNVGARLTDPNRWKAMAGMGPAVSPIQRDAIDNNPAVPLALPATSLPAGALKAAQFLGRDAAARVGTMGALGAGKAALSGDDVASGAGKGLAMGVGGEALGAALSGAGRGLQTVKRALQIKSGSPAISEDAADLLGQAAENLKSGSQRQDLDSFLHGKQVEFDPRQYMGHDAEVDSMITDAAKTQSAYGEVPRRMTMPAQDFNALRGKLDAQVAYQNRATMGMAPTKGVGEPAVKVAANAARAQLHGLAPEAPGLFQDASEALEAAKEIERSNQPATFLSSAAPDAGARVAKIEEMSGVPLQEAASTMRSGRVMANHPSSIKSLLAPVYETLKGGAKSLTGASQPATLTDLILGKTTK